MPAFSLISRLTLSQIGKRTAIFIWINEIRKKKTALFIDGQDSSGQIQVVVKKSELIEKLKERKKGDLVKVVGVVKKKEGKGEEVEINLEDYRLINSSQALPFEIEDNINEDTRYRYRYLDLRNPSSKKLLLVRNQFCYELRNFLHKKDFVEVETPILAQSSPEGEGANCFVVPSNFPNRYYTLPQSPQIFKQLLMVGGFNKYYQIAKSFRNEGARSNRQIEFSQLDLEMSFTTARQIRRVIEKLLKSILKKVFNLEIKIPFPTLNYQQVIKKYGTDKPDLRQNPTDKLSFSWIIDWPLFEYNTEAKKYESLRHPFTIPQRKYIQPLLNNKIKPEKVTGEAFDLVCNGEEILSGSVRIHQRNLQEKVLEILGYNSAEREKHFGYFLEALGFAAPPHGGIGLGIDRLLALILNTNNLKELIAFPKNIDGTCSLTKTPNFIKKKFI